MGLSDHANKNADEQREGGGGGTLLPAGIYTVEVQNAEVRPTASGKGTGLNIGFQVKGGRHDGEWWWLWLAIEHENEKLVRWHARVMKEMFAAMGCSPDEAEELIGQRAKIHLIVQKSKKDGSMENTIGKTGWAPVTGVPATAPAKARATAPATAPADTGGQPAGDDDDVPF